MPATTFPSVATVAPAAGAVAKVTVLSVQSFDAATVNTPPLGEGSTHDIRRVAPVTVRVPTPLTVKRIKYCFTGLLSVSSVDEAP